MPRYFFDVQGGYPTRDDEGIVLDTAAAVVAAAMRTLLEIGLLEVVRNDQRELTVTVRDEMGTEVYRTSLTIGAGWLPRADGNA